MDWEISCILRDISISISEPKSERRLERRSKIAEESACHNPILLLNRAENARPNRRAMSPCVVTPCNAFPILECKAVTQAQGAENAARSFRKLNPPSILFVSHLLYAHERVSLRSVLVRRRSPSNCSPNVSSLVLLSLDKRDLKCAYYGNSG